MISFLTLFLGLTAGGQRLAFIADPSVSAVELRVDGRLVETMSQAPWETRYDFGPDLLPHEIAARAVDASGREIGHVRQLVNVPRSSAEGEIHFDRTRDGHPVAARVTWESVTEAKPKKFSAALDGHPIPVTEISRFTLPRYDPKRVHDLTVELEFSPFESVRLERAFGGGVSESATRELTAVPIEILKGKAPVPRAVSGALSVDGSPARVVAVEEGPAKVIFVRSARADAWFDPSTGSPNGGQGPGSLNPLGPSSGPRFVEQEPGRFDMALGEDDEIRFLYAVPLESEGSRLPTRLFPSSPYYFTGEHGGIPWLLRSYTMMFGENAPERLADAVAVAGLQAAVGSQARAVVLLCADEPPDSSQFGVETVRRYLSSIRVPLFVWCAGAAVCGDVAARWGKVEKIATDDDLRRAVSHLKKALGRQRIVWLEGSFLPKDVVLRGPAADWRLLTED